MQNNILKEMALKRKHMSYISFKNQLLTQLGENDLYVTFKKLFLSNDVENAKLLLKMFPVNKIFNSGEFRKDIVYEKNKEKIDIRKGKKERNNFKILSADFFKFIGKSYPEITFNEIQNILYSNKIVNKKNKHGVNDYFDSYLPTKNINHDLKLFKELQNLGWVIPETTLFTLATETKKSDVSLLFTVMENHVTNNYNQESNLLKRYENGYSSFYQTLLYLIKNSEGSFQDKYKQLLDYALTKNHFLESIQKTKNIINGDNIINLINKISEQNVPLSDINYYLNPFFWVENSKQMEKLLSKGFNVNIINDKNIWCEQFFKNVRGNEVKKNNNIAIIKLSIENGLDIYSKDKEGVVLIDKIEKNLKYEFNQELKNIAISYFEKKSLDNITKEIELSNNKKNRL